MIPNLRFLRVKDHLSSFILNRSPIGGLRRPSGDGLQAATWLNVRPIGLLFGQPLSIGFYVDHRHGSAKIFLA